MKQLLFVVLLIISMSCAIAQTSQPYAQWYGYNKSYDSYTPHSEIKVKAPNNSDVIVIIRNNDKNGAVAGHRYISRGSIGTISLSNGTYQVFFYYGTAWSYQQEMGNGIIGGFTKGVSYAKDNPVQLFNNVLTYELVLQSNGNFSTKPSNKDEVF